MKNNHSPELEALMKGGPVKRIRYATLVFLAGVFFLLFMVWTVDYPVMLPVPCIVYTEAAYARAWVEQKDFSSVAVGQRAKLKLAAYPSERFGVLEGKIMQVANQADRRGRVALKIVFESGLKTDKAFKVTLRGELTATAEIITRRAKLLHQIKNRL